jgi:hypothetical protein
MATSTRKITSQSIRENAKRDHSPKWDGYETWTNEQFNSAFRNAMNYYRLESSIKELKPKVIDWMGRNSYNKEDISSFKKTKDSRCNLTVASVAACLIKGMPPVHPGFRNGTDNTEWLRNEIASIIEAGKDDEDDSTEEVKTKVVAPVINIQDRIREQAGNMSEEIDGAIDNWIMNPEEFDPKAFKVVSLLRGKGAKAAQARYIKSFYQKGLDELLELSSGNADEQLREAYSHNSRKNIKKLIEFYQAIASACDQLAQEAKILKKPRAKKIKPAEDLVKKVKFKQIDDKLGIVSVPPAGLIGAQGAVIYNTKSRKMGVYIAKSSAGLGVKGTSITDFTEKSFQKTLRKPEVQLKEFKEQNTQKRVETWFTKIKTTETVMNGRLNEDIVLLKIFK